MKKIFALALAGVMTAGMTTVAFAKNEETPYLVNADGNTNMYVLNDNEAAVKDIVGNDGLRIRSDCSGCFICGNHFVHAMFLLFCQFDAAVIFSTSGKVLLQKFSRIVSLLHTILLYHNLFFFSTEFCQMMAI